MVKQEKTPLANDSSPAPPAPEQGLAVYDNITAFGRLLQAASRFNGAQMQEYYESPWKWQREYDRWQEMGAGFDIPTLDKMELILDGIEPVCGDDSGTTTVE